LGAVAAVKSEESPVVNEGAELKLEAEVSADSNGAEDAADAAKDDNEMTLEEYEKVLDEKRKALESEKVSERKVEVDKAFEKMQLVSSKKREEDIFIKLGHDKEKMKRDAAEREEKFRKSVSINEFLKPVEGEKHYGSSSSRGRGGRGGRGDRRVNADRGERDSSRGRFGGGLFDGSSSLAGVASAPRIEDKAQFPTLGGT
jgi:plasminogen activator inhibitor 1 RNA-binding protein